MAFFRLMRESAGPRLSKLGVLSAVSGLANAFVMICISQSVAAGRGDLVHLIYFILLVTMYVISERAAVSGSAAELERVTHHIRMKLLDTIRAAQPVSLLRNEPSEIYAAVTKDTQAISQAAQSLTWSVQAAFLLICTALYLLWISPIEFIVLTGLGGAVAVLVQRRAAKERLLRLAASKQEEDLLLDVADLLEGFKEAKTSAARARAQLAAIVQNSQDTSAARIALGRHEISGAVTTQALVYLAIVVLLFALPFLHTISPSTQRQTATALLFVVTSISVLTQAVPVVAEANAAAARLLHLTKTLPMEAAQTSTLPIGQSLSRRLENAGYTWRISDGTAVFHVGPIDLQIAPGEIIFIVGGNGSGKSTLMYLLSGILLPDEGTLYHGTVPVQADNMQSYRDCIGSIFSGSYLFRLPYGQSRKPEDVRALLEEYALSGRVERMEDGAWSSVSLSGGQRKRLAMVELLLDPPEIIILDEWAADQDPGAKQHFYKKTLPKLRASGHTVICATHDERYLSAADRCYVMRDGTLTLMKPLPSELRF